MRMKKKLKKTGKESQQKWRRQTAERENMPQQIITHLVLGGHTLVTMTENYHKMYDDVSLEHLEKMKNDYYETHIAVDTPKIEEIELHMRSQSTSMDSNTEQLWYAERRKRITASRVAGIAKMRKSTKTSNKVKEMVYTKFRGNAHTLYGVINESTS